MHVCECTCLHVRANNAMSKMWIASYKEIGIDSDAPVLSQKSRALSLFALSRCWKKFDENAFENPSSVKGFVMLRTF